MTTDKQRERLVELLVEASSEAGKHFRETTKKVLAEKGRFNSKEDIDRRNIYEIEADYLLANGVIVPPVKYGDKLYIITEVSKTIVETIVIGVWIYEESFTVLTIHGNILNDSFGKTVFPTKEEAEQALKQRRVDEE